MIRAIKIIVALFLVLGLLGYLYFFSNIVFPWQEKDAIKTTLEWGGLAELPVNLKNLKVEKGGSPFTREFVLKFNASQIEIEKWIADSKRLKDITPQINGGIRKFDLHPGEEGSFGGEVVIEDNIVTINMSWS